MHHNRKPKKEPTGVIRYLRISENRHGRTIEALVCDAPMIAGEMPAEPDKPLLTGALAFLLQLGAFGLVGFLVGIQLVG